MRHTQKVLQELGRRLLTLADMRPITDRAIRQVARDLLREAEALDRRRFDAAPPRPG